MKLRSFQLCVCCLAFLCEVGLGSVGGGNAAANAAIAANEARVEDAEKKAKEQEEKAVTEEEKEKAKKEKERVAQMRAAQEAAKAAQAQNNPNIENGANTAEAPLEPAATELGRQSEPQGPTGEPPVADAEVPSAEPTVSEPNVARAESTANPEVVPPEALSEAVQRAPASETSPTDTQAQSLREALADNAQSARNQEHFDHVLPQAEQYKPENGGGGFGKFADEKEWAQAWADKFTADEAKAGMFNKAADSQIKGMENQIANVGKGEAAAAAVAAAQSPFNPAAEATTDAVTQGINQAVDAEIGASTGEKVNGLFQEVTGEYFAVPKAGEGGSVGAGLGDRPADAFAKEVAMKYGGVSDARIQSDLTQAWMGENKLTSPSQISQAGAQRIAEGTKYLSGYRDYGASLYRGEPSAAPVLSGANQKLGQASALANALSLGRQGGVSGIQRVPNAALMRALPVPVRK